jgi:two-component system OmpR family sensor kinase
MAATPQPRSFWQSVRQLPARTPLRAKLITAVLALVAIALAVISFAGLSVIRTYLLNQADSEITRLYDNLSGQQGPFGLGRAPSFAPDPWTAQAVIGGQVIPVEDATGGIAGPAITPSAAWLTKPTGHFITVGSTSGAGRWRIFAYPNQHFVQHPSGATFTGTLVIALDVTDQYHTIGQLVTIDLLVGIAVICLLGVIGIAVIRASLRPLIDIEQTAGAIAAGDLTRRVPEMDPRTEVGRLGRSLNVMLSQIESAFRAQSRSEEAARRSEGRMRQFVADASHELRTPLTAIRGFAEYYRQRGGVKASSDTEAASAVSAEAEPTPPSGSTTPADLGASNGTGRNGTGKLAPADLDRIMRRVEQESARMGVLVEDMLLLARLDQQRPLEHKTVDLLTLAGDAVHDARVVAPSRTINLTVGAGAALLVVGDEVRLRQVIGNLMSNALVHTPDATPIDVTIRSGSMAEIQASAAVLDEPTEPDEFVPDEPHAGDWGWDEEADDAPAAAKPAHPASPHGAQPAAVLEVTDYGPGLTQEQSAHAFERFYRADQARTAGGTGLGLAIVAALVAAHGGAVWVTSRPGQGATFSIALPLAPEAVPETGDHDDERGEPGEPGDQPANPDYIDFGPHDGGRSANGSAG